MNVKIFFKKMLDKERVKRTSDLLIPRPPSKDDRKTCLSNGQWAFVVPYAFRDALDIKYQERVKTEKIINQEGKTVSHTTKYMTWTQGRLIDFKDGDLLTSKDGNYSVQVDFAQPMGWDKSKNELYLGSVTYSLYDKSNSLRLIERKAVDQMMFLNFLINGS